MHEPTVAVFGGGPAGLMAAQTAAESGAQVTLYEQGRTPGRKFLLAGRSGLNLTHSEPLDTLLNRYSAGRSLLEPAIRAFDPEALVAWAASLGHNTFTGSSGRVFPEAFRAASLLRAWLARLDELGVTIRTRHRWDGWSSEPAGNPPPASVLGVDAGGSEAETIVTADAVVLAFGGGSWPRTGSTGDWVDPLVASQISVEPLQPANCGVRIDWTPTMLAAHEGAPIKNLSVNGTRGDLTITHSGLEGGPIYAHASAIGRGDVALIDLLPDLDEATLTQRLESRRKGSTTTAWVLNSGISRSALALVRDLLDNKLPSTAPEMASLLKALPLGPQALMPIDRAISTSGGVTLDSVDHEFMLRRLPGVFVCGEMLAWDAPTGGYLLQACFSTGAAAGRNAAAQIARLAPDRMSTASSAAPPANDA